MSTVTPLVGLFHFNIQYVAGNISGYHRYCIEALQPFLDALIRTRDWRVSFEMAGSGLEFLAQCYPDFLRKILLLIDRDQLELISSTYSPSLWVAFPGPDLVKSVEVNIECLKKLGLPRSGVFFAQEGFFGMGLRIIEPYFDTVVCKDDYLSHFIGDRTVSPAYRLGGLKVIVGSNHLLNECRSRLHHTPSSVDGGIYSTHLASAANSISPMVSQIGNGHFASWYHLGSGHHYAVSAAPGDWDKFFVDERWISVTGGVIDAFIRAGRRYSFISEIANSLSLSALCELPMVVEGSWNASRSGGVFAWMGKHNNTWENAASGLALTWRARKRLLTLHNAIFRLNDSELIQQWNTHLTEMWKLLLLAESSDSFGWAPTQTEAVFTSNCAEELLRQIASLVSKLPSHEGTSMPSSEKHCVLTPAVRLECPTPSNTIALFGASGHIDKEVLDTNTCAIEARFTPQEVACGVLVGTCLHEVVYCPSGTETSPISLNLLDLRPDTIYLPLANGLLGIGNGVYIIRCNEYGQVAACINKIDLTVSFKVEGPCVSRQYRWRFIVFHGSLDKAVQLANVINCIGG